MSQDHEMNVAYRRKRERKMELPVPNYSDNDCNLRSRSLSEVEKRSGSHNVTDNLFSEAYNSSEHSDSPSSSNSHVQEGYASLSTSFQREQSNRSHGSNYQVPHPNMYNGMRAESFASQNQPEMPPKHQLRPHSATSSHGLDEMKKKTGHASSSGPKLPPSQQIEDYKKKATLLRIELETLKDQRNELRGDGKRSASPDTKRFLKENTKLQLEIQNKLKTINNVLDMMNGIIGDHTDLREVQSPERKPKQKWSQKFNYVFYDPEMHWCRVCNVFPQTAKDYLNHLHSPDHQTHAAEHQEAPWRGAACAGFLSLPGAPTKRTPIRGLQFFVPSTAWYCKLCDQFVGDLHCASDHIKSILHSKNYNKFVQQNPHWETDWVSDRQRAFERAGSGAGGGGGEGASGGGGGGARLKQQVKYVTRTLTISKDIHTKRPPKTPPLELEEENRYLKKRKQARSSGQSSLDDSGSESEKTRHKNRRFKSIDMDESKELENFDSPTASESILSDDERKLLESLNSRMRKKNEIQRSTSRDRQRIKEMHQRIKESDSRSPSSERREQRASSRDRRDRDARAGRDRHTMASRDRNTRAGSDRDTKAGSGRDTRAGSDRDTRAGSRERDTRVSRDHDNRASRDRNTRASRDRDTRAGSSDRDTRTSRDHDTRASRDRDSRAGSRELAARRNSHERRSSRDRRPASRDRRGGSRDRRGSSRSRRGDSRDRTDRSRNRQSDGQVQRVGPSSAVPARLPVPFSRLPMPTAAMPKIINVPPRVNPPPRVPLPPPGLVIPQAVMPPVVIPPQSVPGAPPPPSPPAVPAEFRAALELLFPTDPATCSEMLTAMQQPALHQPTLSSLHQPGLLGPPPALPLPYPLGFPPGMFPFPPPNPTLFPTQPLLPNITPLNQRNDREQRRSPKKRIKQQTQPKNKDPRDDDLMLLGIDASDVGAGI